MAGAGMTAKNYRQNLGAWGERLAESFLLEHGLILLARNYRTPFGELDLVMSQDGQIVFIEVKTRSTNKFGPPEDAVTGKKREHLLQAAECYLNEHSEALEGWRIDVVSICGTPGSPSPEIVWFDNALA
jgi:putative endonuclease